MRKKWLHLRVMMWRGYWRFGLWLNGGPCAYTERIREQVMQAAIDHYCKPH